MKKIKDTMEAKLMGYFAKFQLTDLIGFAKILGIEVDKTKEAIRLAAVGRGNWEDFICDMVEAFSNKNRRDRKELLKLAKDIYENNVEFDRFKEQGLLPQDYGDENGR